jgi:hypothetical protein
VTFTLVALTRLASPQLSSRRASGFVLTGSPDKCLESLVFSNFLKFRRPVNVFPPGAPFMLAISDTPYKRTCSSVQRSSQTHGLQLRQISANMPSHRL